MKHETETKMEFTIQVPCNIFNCRKALDRIITIVKTCRAKGRYSVEKGANHWFKPYVKVSATEATIIEYNNICNSIKRMKI